MGFEALQARMVPVIFKKLSNATAVWTPSNGGDVVTVGVIKHSGAYAIPFDGFSAAGADHSMVYQVAEFPGLIQDEAIIINDTHYRVRDPESQSDGVVAVAILGTF